MSNLKPRVDTLGLVLIALSLLLFFIIPIRWWIGLFSSPKGEFMLLWINISQGLGILSAIAFGMYQIYRRNRVEKEKRALSNATTLQN